MQRRAWWLIALLGAACSVELAPLGDGAPAAGASGKSGADSGGGSGTASDACSPPWCGGGSGGGSGLSGAGGEAGGVGTGGDAGEAGSGTGGENTGGSAGAGGSGTGGAVASGGTGAAASFKCFDLKVIDTGYGGCPWLDQSKCRCMGCGPVCQDQWGPVSDCVCPACDFDYDCNSFCNKDGKCDPFAEGCSCIDCKFHPGC
jgi:hypothetical protein